MQREGVRQLPQAPLRPSQSGRPRTTRAQSVLEGSTGRRTTRCSLCKQPGHNKGTCSRRNATPDARPAPQLGRMEGSPSGVGCAAAAVALPPFLERAIPVAQNFRSGNICTTKVHDDTIRITQMFKTTISVRQNFKRQYPYIKSSERQYPYVKTANDNIRTSKLQNGNICTIYR